MTPVVPPHVGTGERGCARCASWQKDKAIGKKEVLQMRRASSILIKHKEFFGDIPGAMLG